MRSFPGRVHKRRMQFATVMTFFVAGQTACIDDEHRVLRVAEGCVTLGERMAFLPVRKDAEIVHCCSQRLAQACCWEEASHD